MSNILKAEIANAITGAVKAVEAGARKRESAVDVMQANGMRSTDFISPKSKDGTSTASPELFDAINAAIIAGFTARAQKLLAAPTKGLGDTDKAEKRYWQQQIGSRRNDFKSALAKREGGSETDRGTKAPKAPEDKLRAALETVEKIVQGNDSWGFDAVDFLKALRDLNRRIK